MARRRYVARTTASFLVRCHMGLIFVATVAAAVLTSRVLLGLGVDSLMWRYGVATAVAYLVFFAFVRAWIFYVTRLAPSHADIDPSDAWSLGHRPDSGLPFHGGGQSGGGGASGTFDSSVDEPPVLRTTGQEPDRGNPLGATTTCMPLLSRQCRNSPIRVCSCGCSSSAFAASC
jgi:hypothetical protein